MPATDIPLIAENVIGNLFQVTIAHSQWPILLEYVMNYSDLRNLQALQKNENAIYKDEMTMSEISCLLHSVGSRKPHQILQRCKGQ